MGILCCGNEWERWKFDKYEDVSETYIHNWKVVYASLWDENCLIYDKTRFDIVQSRLDTQLYDSFTRVDNLWIHAYWV